MRSAALLVILGWLGLLAPGCVPLPLFARGEPPARVLHPEVSRTVGEVWLQPRHAREMRTLAAPILLEPGDWVQTGPRAKAEVLLPQGTLRLYAHTRVQIHFSFEERSAVSREFRLEAGEVLFRKLGEAPFLVSTAGLHVEPAENSTLLIGSRPGVYQTTCYRGAAEARNVRVRGQTVIHLRPGHHLTLDDHASVALLEQRNLVDEWRRWEAPGAFTAGFVPAPE